MLRRRQRIIDYTSLLSAIQRKQFGNVIHFLRELGMIFSMLQLVRLSAKIIGLKLTGFDPRKSSN